METKEALDAFRIFRPASNGSFWRHLLASVPFELLQSRTKKKTEDCKLTCFASYEWPAGPALVRPAPSASSHLSHQHHFELSKRAPKSKTRERLKYSPVLRLMNGRQSHLRCHRLHRLLPPPVRIDAVLSGPASWQTQQSRVDTWRHKLSPWTPSAGSGGAAWPHAPTPQIGAGTAGPEVARRGAAPARGIQPGVSC